jgi:hypothetical protein
VLLWKVKLRLFCNGARMIPWGKGKKEVEGLREEEH